MTRFVPLAAAYLSGCLAIPAASAAPRQQTTSAGPVLRSAAVTATTEAITIDGVLDEPIWSSAPKIGDLIQRQPAPGQPPTERTDVTLLYDRDHLYIGVMSYDSEPRRVIGTQMARDASLASDDRIEILLDTFRDQRSAFYFATNPSGRPGGRPGREWTVEHRLGRHLGRAHQTHGSGMDRGVRDSLQEPGLPGRADRVGLQHRPPHLSKAGGEPLVGCSSGHAVLSGLRGRRDHESCRPDAGDRSRRPPVSRGALAARRRPRTTSTASRGSTCSTTSRPA